MQSPDRRRRFGAKVGAVFFQVLRSWHQRWGIPAESNIPQVGLARSTLTTSLPVYRSCFVAGRCHQLHRALLTSLDAAVAKNTAGF